MPVLASVLAWSTDSFDCACEIFDTEDGCLVQMTLPGMLTLDQRCASVREAFEIAGQWREGFNHASVIDPHVA